MDKNELQMSGPDRTPDDSPSAQHDAAIMRAAGDAARRIRRRRPRWGTRLGLALSTAASFALGAASLWIVDRWALENPVELLAAEESLLVPVGTATRDGRSTNTMVPVEQADPQVWYRHIQELIYDGNHVHAERHLRRFNQLHPNFVHRP